MRRVAHMRAIHDRGGWPTEERIDRREHELADWELLTDAIAGALGARGVIGVDELRRGIESMPPDAYEPAGSEGMSEDELAGLVTRDSMIGVAEPAAPVAVRI